MRFALATLILLQAAPVQSEADKLEAALKKFGNRTYRILIEGEQVGTCSLKTRIDKEGARPVAVCEDRFSVTMGGEEVTMTTTERASLDRLRLVSSKMIGKVGGKETPVTIAVDGRKATMTFEDRTPIFDITDATVGEQAVIRLVCAAEQKEGAEFKVDVLNMTTGTFQPGHAFKCVAKEQIEIGGKKVDAFKWEQKGEWGDGKPPTSKTTVHNVYWVSPDGYLLRNVGRGGEIVLDAK